MNANTMLIGSYSGYAPSILESSIADRYGVGPTIGGYIAETIGWRWIFWISIIFVSDLERTPTHLHCNKIFTRWRVAECSKTASAKLQDTAAGQSRKYGLIHHKLGLLMLSLMPVLRETYPPLLAHRQKSRSKELGDPQEGHKASQLFCNACLRPLRLIFHTRLIPICTIFTSLVNAYLYILLSTLGTTFEHVYSFSPGQSGLAYLGMMVGFVLSELTLGYISDAYASRKARNRPEGVSKPEDRLPPLLFGSLLLPATLLMYGWTLDRETMWLGPVVGSGLVAFVSMHSYIPVQIYVVEVYTLHTASATGAMSIVRSAFAAVLPLAADPLYARLGYGWTYTLLAGLAAPFFGVAVLLVGQGSRIRLKDAPVK